MNVEVKYEQHRFNPAWTAHVVPEGKNALDGLKAATTKSYSFSRKRAIKKATNKYRAWKDTVPQIVEVKV